MYNHHPFSVQGIIRDVTAAILAGQQAYHNGWPYDGNVVGQQAYHDGWTGRNYGKTNNADATCNCQFEFDIHGSQFAQQALHESSFFHEGFVVGCRYSATSNAFEAPAHVYHTSCDGELEPRILNSHVPSKLPNSSSHDFDACTRTVERSECYKSCDSLVEQAELEPEILTHNSSGTVDTSSDCPAQVPWTIDTSTNCPAKVPA